MTIMRSYAAVSFLSFCFWLTIVASADAAQNTRRVKLRDYAREQFTKSNNHCQTFASVADFAAKGAKKDNASVLEFMEDLRLVLIGEDTFLRRGEKRGDLYMGVKTNSSGFKKELRDDSPQVEHAYAAIYFAKGAFMMPGSVGAWGSFIEFLQAAFKLQTPSRADALLYTYAADIGERLSNSNYDQIKTPILRTVCE